MLQKQLSIRKSLCALGDPNKGGRKMLQLFGNGANKFAAEEFLASAGTPHLHMLYPLPVVPLSVGTPVYPVLFPCPFLLPAPAHL